MSILVNSQVSFQIRNLRLQDRCDGRGHLAPCQVAFLDPWNPLLINCPCNGDRIFHEREYTYDDYQTTFYSATMATETGRLCRRARNSSIYHSNARGYGSARESLQRCPFHLG